MFNVLAQTSVSVLTEIMKGAAQWGLGIVLAIILVFIFKAVLMKVLDMAKQQLLKKDEIIENHISHLTNAVNTNNKELIKNTGKMDSGFDRVVNAIEAQTNILKDK